MVRKRNTIENNIVNYIKQQIEGNKVFKKPIAQIAQENGSSTSTVWRVIQKLQDKRVIKIIKSRSVTEPDTIYYLGEHDDLSPMIEQLDEHLKSVHVLVEELSEQLLERQKRINSLTYRLEEYQAMYNQIFNVINRED